LYFEWKVAQQTHFYHISKTLLPLLNHYNN
jgi:UV DNA damage repair endonuclease